MTPLFKLLIAAFALPLVNLVAAAQTPVRIMAFGDSITGSPVRPIHPCPIIDLPTQSVSLPSARRRLEGNY